MINGEKVIEEMRAGKRCVECAAEFMQAFGEPCVCRSCGKRSNELPVSPFRVVAP